MSFGGLIRRTAYWTVDFFKGRPVGKHFSDLGKILKDSTSGLEKQAEYLERLLEHTAKYCEFYKSFAGKDISEFPVVNKVILNENRSGVEVDIRHIPEQKTPEIHVHKTSGSTGVPFAVRQDSRKRNRRVAALKYFGELAGYKSHEKLAQCRVWTALRNKPKFQAFRENIIPVNISVMNDETLSRLCKIMHKKKVSALLGHSGWMESLSEYLKRHPQNFKHLQVVITSGEHLKPEVKEYFKSKIGCDILERYANEEQGVLGQQKNGGEEYHLNHASYYFELLKMESDEPAEYGELGRIVITDLFNYAFPLIRYDTGDVGIMGKPNKYSCGYPVLEKIYGRKMDIIYNAEGVAIHPLSFSSIVKRFAFIMQWQLIQKEEKKYVMRITEFYDAPEAEQKQLIGYIKSVVGEEADVTLEFVNEIPDLRSGKRKPVVCEWERK